MKYYSVTETCCRLKIEPHILRYWEKEFGISAKRNSAGRRIYSSPQLERLQLIRHLLREQKLTVKGARRQLSLMSAQPAATQTRKPDSNATLLWLKKELISIHALLVEPTR